MPHYLPLRPRSQADLVTKLHLHACGLHSYTQQLFSENLPCARHCLQCWREKWSLLHGAQSLVREEPKKTEKKSPKETVADAAGTSTLSPQLSLLRYTQCYPEILHLRAFWWSGHRASWKCQGANIPRSSPQLLSNGNQKKTPASSPCGVEQLGNLFYGFPRKTCSLLHAHSLPSLP